MNILEDIQNCPVEWKELGEVTHSIKTGLNPRKFFQLNSSDASNYYITVREIRGHKIVPSEKTDLINNDGLMLCQNRSNLEIGDVLFTGTGTIGNVAIIEKTPTNWNIKEGVYAIKPKKEQICSKFLMYLFESENIKKEIERRKAGGTVKSVSMAEMKKIKIPIPPLEIQEKIVQILDKMTGYVTELTSRKKQYSFYRDKLLSFEDEVYQVEWKTLGEVAECLAGATPRTSNSSYWENGTIPWMSSGEVNKGFVYDTEKKITQEGYDSCSTKVVPMDTVVIALAGQGKTRGTVAITKVELCTNQSLCSIVSNDDINSHYLYYYLKGQYQKLRDISSGEGTRGGLNLKMIRDFKIPVPSLEIQSRIVQVLDNFDMVCNDLNIGLPKEIELRQKQYEYFREKLLTFVAEGEYTESRVEEWDNSAIIKLLQWVFGSIRVELGAIGDIIRGNGLQKQDFQDAGVPCIHYGQIYTYYGIETDITKSFINLELSKKLQKAKTGDLIVATTSENVEDVGKSLVWLGKDEVCIGGHSCIIKTEQNSKYLAYFFRTSYFQNQKKKRVLGTKVIELYPKNLAKIQIILPPLSTQSQIVSILDNFNTLTSSLSEGLPEEIELRQKQYEYWREQLLNFTR